MAKYWQNKCTVSLAYDRCDLNNGIQCEHAFYDMNWTWKRENCTSEFDNITWWQGAKKEQDFWKNGKISEDLSGIYDYLESVHEPKTCEPKKNDVLPGPLDDIWTDFWSFDWEEPKQEEHHERHHQFRAMECDDNKSRRDNQVWLNFSCNDFDEMPKTYGRCEMNYTMNRCDLNNYTCDIRYTDRDGFMQSRSCKFNRTEWWS